MLTELHIKDKHFNNPIKLSRLNLITGDNNTGKSMLLNYIEYASDVNKHYLNDSIMEEVPNSSYLPNKSLRVGKVDKPLYLTTFLESFNLRYTFNDHSGDNLVEAKYSKPEQILNISTLCESDFIAPSIDTLDNGYHLNNIINHIEYMLPQTGNLILIMEQPETGYDMRTQTDIGLALADIIAAYDRVQIIVETHSECLFNGMRLGIRDSGLTGEDVTINHLTRNGDGTVVEHIAVDAYGRVEPWPDGFFDERDKFSEEMLLF